MVLGKHVKAVWLKRKVVNKLCKSLVTDKI